MDNLATRETHDAIGQVLADNVRGLRLLRRMTQNDLAAQMRQFGHHTWASATVSQVERNQRRVTIDELFVLSLILGVHMRRWIKPIFNL